MLTLSPCIGTDQMGPKRFGPQGRLAFTLGNIAQDEAAAMAEYSISRGWKRAVIVKDNLLAYFQNVADLFKQRYEELGGKVVQEAGFSSFSGTIQNAISKVAPTIERTTKAARRFFTNGSCPRISSTAPRVRSAGKAYSGCDD